LGGVSLSRYSTLWVKNVYGWGNLVNPGGKQPKMRDGFVHSSGRSQAMVFPDNNYHDHTLRGQPKGAEKFLRECGLWLKNGKRSGGLCSRLGCPKSGGHEGYQAEGNKALVTGCCTRDVLARELDFQA
jgi:hypothetical protein